MIQFSAQTHPGLRREHNEDALLAEPECGLFVVADGVGGRAAGEVASALTIQTFAAAGDVLAEVVAAVSVLRRRPSARQVVAQVATLALAVILVERRLFYHWFLAAYDYSSSRFILYESWLDGNYTLTLERWVREFAGRLITGHGTQFPDFHAPLPVFACCLRAVEEPEREPIARPAQTFDLLAVV